MVGKTVAASHALVPLTRGGLASRISSSDGQLHILNMQHHGILTLPPGGKVTEQPCSAILSSKTATKVAPPLSINVSPLLLCRFISFVLPRYI